MSKRLGLLAASLSLVVGAAAASKVSTIGGGKRPALAVGANRLHLVYQGLQKGDNIYYRSSSDGVKWSDETNISKTPDISIDPAVSASQDGTVCVAWLENGPHFHAQIDSVQPIGTASWRWLICQGLSISRQQPLHPKPALCKTLLRAGLCVMEVTSDQPEGKWRLVAEGFDARQLQRLTQALQTGPAPAHPRPQNEGRSVFEFTTPQDEEAIVLHALSVARQLKARVCLRGVTALA